MKDTKYGRAPGKGWLMFTMRIAAWCAGAVGWSLLYSVIGLKACLGLFLILAHSSVVILLSD